MELDAVALRLRFSKRVKFVLPNHSSRRSVSCIAKNIFISGSHLINSRTHAGTVLTGTTIRNGPGTCRSYIIQPRNEIVWNVFPLPISAARMTFQLLDHEKASQFIKQACRYSRSVRTSLWRKLGCLAIRLNLGQASLSNLCRAGNTTFWSCFPRKAADCVRAIFCQANVVEEN
jgi:hypothetical protein